ncbi:unnamed protein product [Caenorhabditis brenneri]
MSIKFNSFPYLVKLAVMNQMNYMSIFMLSLCSIRTKKFIENHLRKDLTSIEYFFSTNGIQVLVENPDGSGELMVGVHASYDTLHLCHLSNTRIGNVQRLVGFSKGEDDLIRIKCPMQIPIYEKSMKRAIIEHVAALFTRSSPTIHLDVHVDDYLGKLVPIPGVESIKLRGNEVNVKFLEEILTKYPNQESAFIVPQLMGELNVDSKLHELQYLRCKNVSRLAVPIAKRFNGRELIFSNADFDAVEEITSILTKWISNEAYHNLEFMYIDSASPIDRTRLKIPQSAKTRWSLEPYTFEYESSNKNSFVDPMSFDCREFYQIERESDRKMAAFRFFRHTFVLLIWNRTRDQFVEMVR